MICHKQSKTANIFEKNYLKGTKFRIVGYADSVKLTIFDDLVRNE